MPLTDAACRNAKPQDKPYKLTDGSGLYLLVQVNGSRLWRFDYSFDGKRKTASFGKYPSVTLIDARAQREAMKVKLRDGENPAEKSASELTFGEVANSWYETNQTKWKTSYSARFWRRIESDILPTLGRRPLTQIEPPEVLKLLRTIEERDAIYSAKRICEMVSTIYRYAISEGHTRFNPAADLKPALKPMPQVKHRNKLKESELREFFQKLRARGPGASQFAIELVAHTFVRPNEIQFARWDEIEGNLWTIPGERMKMGKTHLVHLTKSSLDLLAKLKELSLGSEWVLPGRSGRKPIVNNTLIYFLYDLGYGPHSSGAKTTVHGFRGLASTVLNESGLFHHDWVERQLAHVPMDKIRSAYNAAEYWEHRVKMMEWWSARLEAHAAPRSATDLSDLLL